MFEKPQKPVNYTLAPWKVMNFYYVYHDSLLWVMHRDFLIFSYNNVSNGKRRHQREHQNSKLLVKLLQYHNERAIYL